MRVPLEALTGHGQSLDATIDKERCLGAALAISMKIAAAKFGGRGYAYWHFDANAGSGHNDVADVPGSPVVFHVAADQHLNGMRRHAFFCDLNSDALLHLESRLAPWRALSRLHLYDNERCLDIFAECIRQSGEQPRYALGSVIVDPNGYWYRNKDGHGPPTKSLIRFAQEFPRIDIVLNLNARTFRLQRAQGHPVLSPRDVLGRLNKSNWLIRRTCYGGDDWLLAVGRNVKTGDHRRIGFHKLESAEGHAIMTMIEGRRQRGMFDADRGEEQRP